MKGLLKMFNPERLVSLILAILVILLSVWLLRTLGKLEGFQEGNASSTNKSLGGATRSGGTTKAVPKKK